MKILMAGFEKTFRQNFSKILSHHSYHFLEAGEALPTELKALEYDVVILELDARKFSELNIWILNAREMSFIVPIIIRDHENAPKLAKLALLESGADFCLSVNPTELTSIQLFEASIKAIVRCASGHLEERRYGNITIDFETLTLCVPGEENVYLTFAEYMVLKTLIRHRKKVVSRDVLKEACGPKMSPSSHHRSVDTLVSKIRKKLSENSGVEILTIHEAGYLIQLL